MRSRCAVLVHDGHRGPGICLTLPGRGSGTWGDGGSGSCTTIARPEEGPPPAGPTFFAVVVRRPQAAVLVELALVDNAVKAVMEVLDGAIVVEVARRDRV